MTFVSKARIFCRFSYACVSFTRTNSTAPKVALIGANGGIGQPLGLLLKTNPAIAKLSLYDIVGTPGVGADLSHIDSPAQISSHTGPAELSVALEGADVIIVPAGVPRKPGMSRDDLFASNASVVRDIAEAAAKICPKAFLAIITNPVNSTVPIASEVYKNNGVYDPKRIFGVTSLDIVRAQTFIAKLKKLDVLNTVVDVIGGHSGVTIIPLFSQTKPSVTLSDQELKVITERTQEAGTEVVKAKDGKGSATLSMAFAGARFVNALLNGLKGQKSVQCAYVQSNLVKGVDYFASPLEIGPNGVEKIQPLPKLSFYEQQLLDAAIPELQKNINTGTKFIKG